MADWDLTFDGTLLGSATVGVRAVEGLDLPPLRTSDQTRAQQHGLFAGRDLAGGRAVVVEFVTAASSASAAEAALGEFATKVVPRGDEAVLAFQVPGHVLKRVNCRPRRRSLRYDVNYAAVGYGSLLVEFFATDPRIYADAASSGSTGFPTVSGGRSYPLTFPRTYGSVGSGGAVTAVNDGDFAAPWTATFTGPWVDPRIEHVGQGKTLRMVGSLAAGETLVVDSLERTILLGGTASRYSWLQAGSEWFELISGSNEIRFAGSSGSGSAQLDWRDTWL